MKRNSKALDGISASDLMSPNPLSINAQSTVREAVTFLTEKGFSAAPVIDHAGRPVGVVSRADILVHDRENVEYVPSRADYYDSCEPTVTSTGETLPKGFQVEKVDRTRVRDIMTPAVFAVEPETSAQEVVETMTRLKVHRLFVVGEGGVLVGVISALDIVAHLCTPESRGTREPNLPLRT
jgi:CBS domain-containing protein